MRNTRIEGDGGEGSRRKDGGGTPSAPQQSAERRVFSLSRDMAAEPLSPFCPPLQTEICEAVCADGRKARTLNWTKPPTLLGRRGYPASVAICQKKKRKKEGEEEVGWEEKNMNHFSQELEDVRVREDDSTTVWGGGERINSTVKERISR